MPAQPPFYRATVPVFVGVLGRLAGELARAEARWHQRQAGG